LRAIDGQRQGLEDLLRCTDGARLGEDAAAGGPERLKRMGEGIERGEDQGCPGEPAQHDPVQDRRAGFVSPPADDDLAYQAWFVQHEGVGDFASAARGGGDRDRRSGGVRGSIGPFEGEYRDNVRQQQRDGLDRKSTRLNSSHVKISYAVFSFKKKN